MLEWIARYWLEVLFGLICAGIAWSARHHLKLTIEAKKRAQEDMLKAIDNKFDEQKTGMKE